MGELRSPHRENTQRRKATLDHLTRRPTHPHQAGESLPYYRQKNVPNQQGIRYCPSPSPIQDSEPRRRRSKERPPIEGSHQPEPRSPRMPVEEHIQLTEENSSSTPSGRHKIVRGQPFLDCTSAYPKGEAFHSQMQQFPTCRCTRNKPNTVKKMSPTSRASDTALLLIHQPPE